MPPLAQSKTLKAYGRTWDYMPTIGVIFGYEGAELETLGKTMGELASKYQDEPHRQVDGVWVLNRGSLTWADPNTHNINPCPNPGDAFPAARSTPGQVLLQLAAHLNEYFAAAWTNGFRFRDYLGNASFGVTVGMWAPDSDGTQPQEGDDYASMAK